MKVKWKQLFTGTLAVALLLCLMMTSAFAENPTTAAADSPETVVATTEATSPDTAVTPEEKATTESATPATQSAPTVTTQGDTVTDPVAKIGDTGYATLAGAVAAAKDGDTIVLQKDTAENVLLKKSITLDLNKHTLTTSANGTGVSDATVTIENGTVTNVGTAKAGTGANDTALTIYPGGKLTIAKDATVKGSWVGITSNPINKACDDASLTVYGTVEGLVDSTGNGGGIGIFSSGNTTTGSGLSVTIKDGATVKGAHGADPTSTSNADGQGIGMNGHCTVTVEGGTISGDEAIGQKAGNLVVNGGTLNGTGAWYDPADPNGSGSESTGAAISVTNTYVKNKNGSKATLTITGGNIISTNGNALYEGKSKNYLSSDALLDSLSITGGTFKGGRDDAVVSTMSKFIAGGTYSSDPTAYGYLADNEVAVKDGDVFNVVAAITVVDTAPTVADAQVALPSTATDVQKEAAAAAKDQLANSSATLGADAQSTAAKVTTEDVQKQATALSDAGVTIDDTTTVTVFVQPSIVVKVTDATVDAKTNKVTALKLDVKAYLQKVATTATDPADIKTDGTGQNAIVVPDSVTPLEPSDNVTLTLPLASDFAVSDKLDNVAMKHEKTNSQGKVTDTYYYKANVTGDAANGYVATVEDTHGFSSMTLFTTSDQKATITYTNNGKDVTSKEYTIDDVFKGTALPSAGDLKISKDGTDGYALAGWNLGGTIYTTMTGNLWTALEGKSFANTAMAAEWTPNKYTVTFDANGGTGEMAQQTITYSTDGTALSANTFSNGPHKFEGWLDDANHFYTDKQAYKGASDVTLYAQWDHYVTFNKNNGDADTITQNVADGAKVTSFQNPTRTGFTFNRWNTKPDGSGDDLDATHVFTSADGDPTYYAVWDPIEYTISVYNDSAAKTPLATINAVYDTTDALPAADKFSVPEGMAGYTLSYITDNNGNNYNPGQNVSNLATEKTDVKLYGNWVDASSNVVISFDGNSKDVRGTMTNQVVKGDQTLSLMNGQFTLKGYHFTGWKDNNGKSYTDGQSVNATTLKNEKVTTLYAQWAQNTGTVAFDANGGTEDAPSSLAVPTTYDTTLPEPSFTRDGYTLQDQWNDSKDGSGNPIRAAWISSTTS